MTRNLSAPDSKIRLAAAGIIVALILFGLIEGMAVWILGLVAVVLAVTSFTGFCPLYRAIGFSSVSRRRR